jgi:tRNA (guanine-N1)-methyltransferase
MPCPVSHVRFDLITIFPEFFAGPLDYGIVRRAREAGIAEVRVHDLRRWTHDRHKTVDDRPFGGGEGMVMKPEPIFEAVESLTAEGAEDAEKTAIVLLSAAGKLFRQETARRLAGMERVVLICGRYEGVDERVAEHLATDELSIGDFVLSGGELPAAMVVDAVTRLLPRARQRRFFRVRVLQPCRKSECCQLSAVSHQHLEFRISSFEFRSSRLSALHAPRGVPRMESPGGPVERQPRGDPPLAPGGRARQDAPQPPRPAAR